MTVRELLIEAYTDISVLAAGEVLEETEATYGLGKLTRVLDNLNAERAGVYASRPTSYTLTADLNPHTIGPAASSPTFTVTQRPVSIEAANLVVGSGVDAIHYPLDLVNQQWYENLSMPALATWPYALWYSADWPLGRLYLFPVPDDDYGLQIWTRVVLSELALDDTFSMPPGYLDAIIKTLGEMLAPAYPPAVADVEGAAKARARVFANNDVQPSLATADAGLTGNRPGGGWTIINTLRGY